MSQKRLAIIGGGAAGIFAAIQTAEHNRCTKITVFEASSSLLQKVKISGGGRCNVTHNCFDPQMLIQNYPRGKQFLKRAFFNFQPQDTVKWFANHGVKLKAESDGRMFPVTDSSQTIIDCFLKQIQKHHIEIKFQHRIKKIIKQNNSFEIFSNDQQFTYDAILLATGSSAKGYEIAKSVGHTIVDTIPSLFTFKISDRRLKDISGVSCRNVLATLSFGKKKYQHAGPVVVTHWGLSGPAILKLSAFAARELCEQKYNAKLSINFAPQMNQDEIREMLFLFKAENARKKISTGHPFDFPKSLWNNIIQFMKIDPESAWSSISKKELNQITEQIQHSTFDIEGKGIFKEEFVTCGGVSLKEVDSNSLQSKKCENLYFAGEILDIDGITGGFNFQSAWTTAFIAGKSI